MTPARPSRPGTRTSGAVVVLVLVLLVAAACGGTSTSARDKRVNDPVRRNSVSASVGHLRLQAVRIEKPVGVHAAGSTSALFLSIANSGDADRLVAVSSVDAGSVVVRSGDQAPEPGIDVAVPAEGVVSLQHASGLHLELVDLTRDLGKRTFVPVTFRFEKAGPVNVNVFVSGVDHAVVSPLPSP